MRGLSRRATDPRTEVADSEHGDEQRSDHPQQQDHRLGDCHGSWPGDSRFDDAEGVRAEDVEGLRAGPACTEEVEAHAEAAEAESGCESGTDIRERVEEAVVRQQEVTLDDEWIPPLCRGHQRQVRIEVEIEPDGELLDR